jgi:hypothetical protein
VAADVRRPIEALERAGQRLHPADRLFADASAVSGTRIPIRSSAAPGTAGNW